MNLSFRSPRAARVLGLLVLVVTFAAGALAATAVSQVLRTDPESPTRHPGRGGDCDRNRGRLLDRLDLSPDQRTRIDAILDRRREETDRFWSTAGPTLGAIMDSTRAEIREVLTPEQRAEYERLRQERKAAERGRSGQRDSRD